MRVNAEHFEDLASGVMKHAAESSKQEVAILLDIEIRLFTGMTLLDLAFKGSCFRFIRTCCPGAVQTRLYGDLDPHLNSRSRILLNLAFFGLPAAFSNSFLQWRAPPIAEVVRGRSQCRARPEGYPYKLSAAEGPSKKQRVDKLHTPQLQANRRRNSKELTDRELNEQWQFTFSPKERWQLFWKAPLISFVVNQLITSIFTIIFTVWFSIARLYPSTLLQSDDRRSEVRLPDHPFLLLFLQRHVEIRDILFVYFCFSFLKECFAALLHCLTRGYRNGLQHYLLDPVGSCPSLHADD